MVCLRNQKQLWKRSRQYGDKVLTEAGASVEREREEYGKQR